MLNPMKLIALGVGQCGTWPASCPEAAVEAISYRLPRGCASSDVFRDRASAQPRDAKHPKP